MLYSEYSKKMTKVAAVVKTVRRYKILIICIVAALLVVAATLMGTRGLVYDSAECPNEVPYGSEISYRAGAFLGGVEYEYCAVGSTDWTFEKPIRAGRYYVRAVSERTFGAKSYGKVHEFTITPKPTDISIADNVLYGELPEYSAELVYGDTFTISEFIYADISKTSTLVKADLDSVKVTDINGDDVTSSYAFVSEYSDIAFTPREIELTVSGDSKEYDGEPLICERYEHTGGTLAKGDGIVTVFDKSQTEVGSTENTPIVNVSHAVLNLDGIDVTANYKITLKVGTLTVKKREILVNTLDGTHVYDDTPFSYPEFEIAEGYSLAGSDRLVAVVAQSVTDVCDVDNKILFEVHNASGEDVTYNYSIVLSPGTLSVTKREVEMVSADASKVYDGAPLENQGYRMDGTLAAGHSFMVTESTRITNAGSIFNALSGVVYGVDGTTDKTDNYEIIWQYGTLTVSKRKVKVLSANAEWTYDGYTHSHSGDFSIVPYDDDTENTGLISGHRLTDVSSTEVTGVVRGEDGEALAVDNIVAFRVIGGGNDYTENYDIETVAGTLLIKPREITIQTVSREWMYDGAYHADNGCVIIEGSLADNQIIAALDSVTVRDVALDNNGNVTDVANDMDIHVRTRGLSDVNDVTDNYNIKLELGKLRITKRYLSLYAVGDRQEYNGERIVSANDGVALWSGKIIDGEIIGGLINGHTCDTPYREYYAVDADTYVIGIDIDRVVVYDSTDKPNANIITYNYEIECIDAELEIMPRDIYVKTETAEWEYDGASHVHTEYEFCASPLGTVPELVYGHSLAVTNATIATNVVRNDDYSVSSIDNVLMFEVIGTRQSNYYIHQTFGKLTVKPRPITVTTASNSWVYDGEVKRDHGFDITVGTLVLGHSARMVNYYPVLTPNVMEQANRLDIVITDGSHVDRTTNYDITYIYGTISITRRTVYIRTESRSWVYDGSHHFWGLPVDVSNTDTTGVVEGFRLRAWADTTVRDVLYDDDGNVIGVRNDMTCDITDSSDSYTDSTGFRYADNYIFEIVEYGTVMVTPRPITVRGVDTVKVFNGLMQFPDHELTSGSLAEGQTGEALFDEGYIYVGENSCEASGFKVYSGNEETTRNYSVTVDDTACELIITKRPIKLISFGTEDDYRYYNSDYWYYDDTEKSFEEFGMYPDHDDKGNPHPERGLCFKQIGNSYVPIHRPIADDGSFSEYIDAGTYENRFTAKLFEIEEYAQGDEPERYGKDVTYCYDITYEYGELTIMPRPITVQAGSDDKIYDGTPLTFHSYAVLPSAEPKMFDLVEWHEMDLTFTPESTRTNAGSTPNVIDIDSITIRSDGRDVTYNYDITVINGHLTVFRRTITVTTDDRFKEYDGTALVGGGATVNAENGDVGLLVGHTAIFGSEIISITEVKENTANSVYVDYIQDEFGNDVTDNYKIDYNFGALTIIPRKITITTASNSWVYDGEYKYDWNYEITEGSLVAGQTSRMLVYYPYICDVGEVANKMDVVIYDDSLWNMVDRTDNYEITYIEGTLTITPRIISVTTATDEWDYDGVAHFNNTYELTEGELVSGHSLIVDYYVTITDPGTVDNILKFVVMDDISDFTHVVTRNYEIRQTLGTLTVNPSDGPKPPPGEPVPIINVKSDITGTLYLRSDGYGVYDGTTDWTASPEYTGQKINYNGSNYSVNYLASIALKNAGLTAFNTEIEVLHGQFMSVLPYFTTLESGPDYGNDIGYVGTERTYGVKQYLYNYVDDNGATLSSVDLGIYRAIESAYREYVYATYLDVPSATAEYMRGVISARKLNKSDPAVIDKVARYIKSSAKYIDKYNPALDASGDVAVAFLETYKEGVCRHYATSATLLFRTLGIPARYTVGAICDAEAGKWVEVTSDKAHAWVEVYIDGIGWVNVEVTGGGFGGSGGGGDQPPPEEVKDTIIVKPVDVEKEYTGEEIFAEQAVEGVTGGNVRLEELIGAGYTYTVVVIGSRVDIGTTVSMITEFNLFDPSGNNVTDDYNIRFDPGVLRVTKTQIVVYMPTYSKMYDGTPLKFVELFEGEYGYYWLDLPQGVSDLMIDMTLYGGITDVGDISGARLADEFERLGAFTVISNKGENVTDNYTVVFASGGLTVERRDIKLTAGSREKMYDGTALTCDDYSITLGSLAAGHDIQVTIQGSITDIGEANNMIIGCIITDADGNDVSANYSIKVVAGTLTVK